MKRILKNFLVVIATMTMVSALAACSSPSIDTSNMNLNINCSGLNLSTSVTHTCAYGFHAVGLNKTSDSHQIVDQMAEWSKDHQEPTIYNYYMLADYNVGGTITLGKNVYVGICEYDSELTYSSVSTVDGQGGFFVYDCSLHGCYYNMTEALPLDLGYMEFVLTKTNLEAAMSATEGEPVSMVPLTIPVGTYSLTEVFEIGDALTSGLVVFEDAQNTKICVATLKNELIANNDTEGLLLLQEMVKELTDRKIQVNDVCEEPKKNANTAHSCAFIPSYNGNYLGVALTQNYVDNLTDMLAALAEQGKTMEPSNNAVENYIFGYLVEDVTIDNAYPVPAGYTLAICKNGYDLECEIKGNVFVYDCDPHVCLACGGEEMIGVHNDALRVNYLFAKEMYNSETLPLMAGDYALMEALDLTNIKLYAPASAEITLCVNSFVDEKEHTALENFLFEDKERENFEIISCIYPIEKTHQCAEISPHITALLLGNDGFAPYLNANNEFIFEGKGVEQAYALTSDIVLTSPITVPTGANIQICLNGYDISWMKMSGQGSNMITVEYGASLTISDCSGEYSVVRAYNAADSKESKNSVLDFNFINTAPVCNYGTFTLNSGNLLGIVGMFNYGDFYMNGGSVNGIMGGVVQKVASANEKPLHSTQVEMKVKGGVINAPYYALCVTKGDANIKNAVVNTGFIGVMFGMFETYTDDATLNNVKINVSETCMAVFKDMAADEMPDSFSDLLKAEGMEGVSSFAELFNSGLFIGLYLNGEVDIAGDVTIEVEDSMLQPYAKVGENGEAEIVYPYAWDILIASGKINVKDGVKFTDTYSVSLLSSTGNGVVVVNKGLIDVFIPVEGFASKVNENNELVFISSSNAEFMNYAKLGAYNFNLAEGRLVFDFYCEFTSEFINDNDALVRIMYGDGKVKEFKPTDGDLLENGSYHFTVSFMAKDYQDKVKIQFTNGEYVWYGTGDISGDYPWQNTIGAKGISVKEYLEGVIGFAEMYEEEYAKILAIMEEYEKEVENTPEGETAPAAPFTDEFLSTIAAMGPFLKEYKTLAEGMLAYCEAAAVQFGVEIEQEQVPINPISTYTLRTPVEAAQDDWTMVTTETLAPYKAVIAQDAKMPEGVQLAGITLVLEAYTNIRIYFNLSKDVEISDYIFTLNGEVVKLKNSKKENQKFLQISGLTASELKNMHTISISDGTDTFTFEYSAMSYTYAVLSSDKYEETLKDLARAMWVYATRTENFIDMMSGNSGLMTANANTEEV